MNDVNIIQNCVTKKNGISTNFTEKFTIKNTHNMKKSFFLAIIVIFSMGATMVFAGNEGLKPEGEKSAVPVKTENKLSEAEINRLTKRVEEIRDMDKSEMSSIERKELRKELKETRKNVKSGGGTIYIGGATLLLIILLVILLV